MKRAIVHAVAATSHGGVNLIRNTLENLREMDPVNEYDVFLPPIEPYLSYRPASNVRLHFPRWVGRSIYRRFVFDQIVFRMAAIWSEADVILATGNFGVIRPPVRQIVFENGPLIFSPRYFHELRRRGLYGHLLLMHVGRQLARGAIRSSECVIPPSNAMKQIIRRYVDVPEERFVVLHHGFDVEQFRATGVTPGLWRETVVRRKQARVVVLMMCRYGYWRNFETLVRAIPHLKRRGIPVTVVWPARIGPGIREEGHDSTETAELIERLGVDGDIVQIGTLPYEQVHHLYALADVACFPSFAESFGFPLVEAMAAGVPLAASDEAVNREICGESASYFPTFDEEALAARIGEIVADPARRGRMVSAGLVRCQMFSWKDHTKRLLDALWTPGRR